MTTSTETRERTLEIGFSETSRGVQSASQAFDDGRENSVDADERAKAWRVVLMSNLL